MKMKKLIICLIFISIITIAICAFNHFNKNSSTINDTLASVNSYKCKNMSLNYIPDGFELTYAETNSSVANLIFENDSLYFIVTLDNITTNKNVDTEDSTIENIYINKNEGVYIKKKSNDNKILVWHYGRKFVFDITGNIPKEDMFKIAENTTNPKL